MGAAEEEVCGRTSSRDSACLNVWMVVLAVVKGRVRFMITPTLDTVSLWAESHELRERFSGGDVGDAAEGAYQTPTNSILTSLQKVCLKPAAKVTLLLSVCLKSLYANGTCSGLSLGKRPI